MNLKNYFTDPNVFQMQGSVQDLRVDNDFELKTKYKTSLSGSNPDVLFSAKRKVDGVEKINKYKYVFNLTNGEDTQQIILINPKREILNNQKLTLFSRNNSLLAVVDNQSGAYVFKKKLWFAGFSKYDVILFIASAFFFAPYLTFAYLSFKGFRIYRNRFVYKYVKNSFA